MYFGRAVLLLRYKHSSNAWSPTERRRKESKERQNRIQGQTLYSKLLGEHSEVVVKWFAMIQGFMSAGCHRDCGEVDKSMMTGIYIVLVRIFYRLFRMCFAEAFVPFERFFISEVTKNLLLFSLRPSHEVQISAGSPVTGLNKS